MNNHQKMLKACVTEGYTVLKNGDVISPSGEKIKPYKWGKWRCQLNRKSVSL